MAEIQVERLEKRYGGTLLFDRLDFLVVDGEFMVIIGPSGCGKSTLLRIIAGIEEMQAGAIRIGAKDVAQMHPGDRDVAMVFQDYALYPHMSVEGNLAFGLRARGVRGRELRERVRTAAATVGLEQLLHRRPSELSGGQRQRVALARAMIREPRAYLMDEPLSNLDAHLRVQMRGELIEFHRRRRSTILYVTHDQVEAMTMGDRIAVMSNGRFEQIGTPDEIYKQPANLYVAGFLGSPRMNFLAGSAERRAGAVAVSASGTTWTIPTHVPIEGGITVGFRPEAVAIGGAAPDEGRFQREIDYVENLGHEAIVHLKGATEERPPLIARVHGSTVLPADGCCHCRVAVTDLSIFDTDGNAVFHGDSLRISNENEAAGAASNA